uniref:glycoside hydrolase family 38 C-terminal domain-containing protein n=1 Tax=Agreia sp. TaxID=1872416 RepID=UPI0035BC85A8
ARAERLVEAAVAALVGPGEQDLVPNAAPHVRDGVAALGIGPAAPAAGEVRAEELTEQGRTCYRLDNGVVRVVVDGAGQLTSLVDAASGRDAIAPGDRGLRLQLHRDIPNQWDAWDVDRFYRNRVVDLVELDALTPTVGADGIARIEIERSFSASSLRQVLSLAPGAHEVLIEQSVDWHETEKFLKVAFPLDVRAERTVAETQFGVYERPTHTNTSWDVARHETSAHRWIHAGEPEFGVAIVNDSTYGYDVARKERAGGGAFTLARLSIVRAALFPDPNQDQGHHTLRVGVLAGAGIREAVEAGYRINLDERHIAEAGVDQVAALFALDNPGVVIETVKLAEDRSGDVVVRLYESLGQRSTATLDARFDFGEVAATDLLERVTASGAQPALSVDGAAVSFSLRPFQLATLRFGIARG